MEYGSAHPRNSSDAAIDDLAAKLHLILGDLVDDLIFVDLVNAAAGVTS